MRMIDEIKDDPEWLKALDIAREERVISISMMQRRLMIGYNRAARIMVAMEETGIASLSDGTGRPRLVDMDRLESVSAENT